MAEFESCVVPFHCSEARCTNLNVLPYPPKQQLNYAVSCSATCWINWQSQTGYSRKICVCGSLLTLP